MLEHGNIREKVASHPETRGWFMGQFIPEGDFFHSKHLELKYRVHKKGELYQGSTSATSRKTIGILISGKVKFIFPELKKEFLLEHPFDYIADDEIPGAHTIEILEDSTLLAVRYRNS